MLTTYKKNTRNHRPINYWGIVGENYVESEMLFPPEKFTMHEASVGPVSSNWDRACELYAQIVGGQVDYGEAHSHNVHDRKGKTYAKGFVEDWGPDNPIALVGHSMGGQTIRMLEILLNEGAPAEVTKSGDDVSPLFKGSNKGWIRSITTISTPHDGTTLVSAMGGSLVGLVKNLVGGFAGIAGDSVVDLLYDFDLDHFQLTKGDSESYREYHERVMKSKLWEPGFKDYAGYDLSLEGAEKMNAMGPQAYPETTYFAVITSQTFRGFIPFSKYFFPHVRLFGRVANLLIYSSVSFIHSLAHSLTHSLTQCHIQNYTDHMLCIDGTVRCHPRALRFRFRLEGKRWGGSSYFAVVPKGWGEIWSDKLSEPNPNKWQAGTRQMASSHGGARPPSSDWFVGHLQQPWYLC
jgi:triacylglycerol esterase/lipase EstA (alpha/beta hydrolase family)